MKSWSFVKNVCSECNIQNHFPRREDRDFGEVLGLVHCDVQGLAKTTSLGGVQYFLTFTNNWSRKTFCYFL